MHIAKNPTRVGRRKSSSSPCAASEAAASRRNSPIFSLYLSQTDFGLRTKCGVLGGDKSGLLLPLRPTSPSASLCFERPRHRPLARTGAPRALLICLKTSWSRPTLTFRLSGLEIGGQVAANPATTASLDGANEAVSLYFWYHSS